MGGWRCIVATRQPLTQHRRVGCIEEPWRQAHSKERRWESPGSPHAWMSEEALTAIHCQQHKHAADTCCTGSWKATLLGPLSGCSLSNIYVS